MRTAACRTRTRGRPETFARTFTLGQNVFTNTIFMQVNIAMTNV